jgi:predicted kinase
VTSRVLVVVAGLPGTGKSTVAAGIAERLGVPVFAKDVIEASLWRSGVGAEQGSWQVAEDMLTTLASSQLDHGRGAVLDTVAGRAGSRAAWRDVAQEHGTPFVVIECVCSDEEQHRSRIDGRTRDIPGWYELTWDDVQRSRQKYEAWTDERLVLDAVDPASQNLDVALAYIADRR